MKTSFICATVIVLTTLVIGNLCLTLKPTAFVSIDELTKGLDEGHETPISSEEISHYIKAIKGLPDHIFKEPLIITTLDGVDNINNIEKHLNVKFIENKSHDGRQKRPEPTKLSPLQEIFGSIERPQTLKSNVIHAKDKPLVNNVRNVPNEAKTRNKRFPSEESYDFATVSKLLSRVADRLENINERHAKKSEPILDQHPKTVSDYYRMMPRDNHYLNQDHSNLHKVIADHNHNHEIYGDFTEELKNLNYYDRNHDHYNHNHNENIRIFNSEKPKPTVKPTVIVATKKSVYPSLYKKHHQSGSTIHQTVVLNQIAVMYIPVTAEDDGTYKPVVSSNDETVEVLVNTDKNKYDKNILKSGAIYSLRPEHQKIINNLKESGIFEKMSKLVPLDLNHFQEDSAKQDDSQKSGFNYHVLNERKSRNNKVVYDDQDHGHESNLHETEKVKKMPEVDLDHQVKKNVNIHQNLSQKNRPSSFYSMPYPIHSTLPMMMYMPPAIFSYPQPNFYSSMNTGNYFPKNHLTLEYLKNYYKNRDYSYINSKNHQIGPARDINHYSSISSEVDEIK